MLLSHEWSNFAVHPNRETPFKLLHLKGSMILAENDSSLANPAD
jgi:hypothetical protein